MLNPSVIRRSGRYVNFYSGYNGIAWATGEALSTDGLNWTKTGEILAPKPGEYIAANGSLIAFRGQLLYYFQSGSVPAIRLLQRSSAVVLDLGPYGSWDERGVADPYAIQIGDTLYLYYLGMDGARRQRLGVAMSRDGTTWYKLRFNPILELGEYGSFDENGLGEPAVWAAQGYYWMLYTGRGRNEQRRLGLARSLDGVRWEKQPTVISGDQSWDSQVICDPTVIIDGSTARVWFGGGDKPRPDQNVDGRIGYGELIIRPR